MLPHALVSALSALALGQPMAHDTTPFTAALRFDVTDTTAAFEHSLGDSLVLRVSREGSLGWIVSVVRRSPEPNQPNLLYHSRAWHGPYPTDVLAWSFKSRYFPDERLLPVYGYPYEIRIRLIDCRTAGRREHIVFAAGTIEVAWRRGSIHRRLGARRLPRRTRLTQGPRANGHTPGTRM
jgi:hypothetical protein